MSFRQWNAARARTGALALTAALVVLGVGCSGSDEKPAPGTTTVAATSTTTSESTTHRDGTTTTVTSSLPDSSTTTPDDTDPPGPPPGEALLEPTGAFLSSHRIPVGDPEILVRSVCQTTPGATCVITFTQGEVTESLPEQVVDETGVTSWTWSPAELGLGSGHWDVQIVASIAAEQRIVDEAIGLEMVP